MAYVYRRLLIWTRPTSKILGHDINNYTSTVWTLTETLTRIGLHIKIEELAITRTLSLTEMSLNGRYMPCRLGCGVSLVDSSSPFFRRVASSNPAPAAT